MSEPARHPELLLILRLLHLNPVASLAAGVELASQSRTIDMHESRSFRHNLIDGAPLMRVRIIEVISANVELHWRIS